MQKSMLRRGGFTLIEMLMTIAVLAVLCTLAMPSYGKLIGRTHVRTARDALNGALNQARLAAVDRRTQVVICPSADQRQCDRTTQWQHGWIVFADIDHDRKRSDGDPLIAVAQAQPGGVAILTSGGRLIVDYHPDGSAGGSNLALTICDRAAGATDAMRLVVNNAGRARSDTPDPARTAACLRVAG